MYVEDLRKEYLKVYMVRNSIYVLEIIQSEERKKLQISMCLS